MQIELKDPEGWQKTLDANKDSYGACGMRYMEAWAILMQERMLDGSSVAQVADKASHDADTEGVTGFMYGLAVSILSQVWIHGDALRKWHNKEYDYEGEGTVNPALLTIGQK